MGVPSQEGHPHHLCTLDKLLGGSVGVVPLAAPGAERRRLQRPPVGEGEGPWPHQRARVDGVEVDGSLLLTLTPGQEGDACGEWGYGTEETQGMAVLVSATGQGQYLAQLGARCGAER